MKLNPTPRALKWPWIHSNNVHQGQGGLMDVVPHPYFASNRLLYLSYSKPIGDGSSATTAVARGRFENDRLTDVEDIYIAMSRGRGHYGSRIVFDGNGYMFVSVGDRQAPPRGDLEAHPAQDLANNNGTINRLEAKSGWGTTSIRAKAD